MSQTFFPNASQDDHSPLPGVPTAKVQQFFEIHKQINIFNTIKKRAAFSSGTFPKFNLKSNYE